LMVPVSFKLFWSTTQIMGSLRLETYTLPVPRMAFR